MDFIDQTIDEYRKVSGSLDKDCEFIKIKLQEAYELGKEKERIKIEKDIKSQVSGIIDMIEKNTIQDYTKELLEWCKKNSASYDTAGCGMEEAISLKDIRKHLTK